MIIRIDEGLSALMPPMNKSEYQFLLESIQEDGIYVPIVIWKSSNPENNGIIVDGETRYKIGKQLNIPIPYVYKEFDSIHVAKIWMIRNQMGRRILPTKERANLAVELKCAYEIISRERMKAGVEIDMNTRNKYMDNDGVNKPKPVTKKSIKKLDEINKKASEERKNAWMAKYPEFNVSVLVQKLGYEPWEYPTKWAADPRSKGH